MVVSPLSGRAGPALTGVYALSVVPTPAFQGRDCPSNHINRPPLFQPRRYEPADENEAEPNDVVEDVRPVPSAIGRARVPGDC